MTSIHRAALIALATALIAAACTGDSTPTSTSAVGQDATTSTTPGRSYAGTDPAPEFPDGLDWLNTSEPLSIAGLRGKAVLLDFWTYGCINCIHIIPDLKRLEAEFADELVVIGVHSAKFENEGDTDNIRNVIVRYDLEHPVVNDKGFLVWQTWGANAWPTTVLIDPAGNVVGGHSGEGVYEVFQPALASLVAEFDRAGALDRTPLDVALERDAVPDSVLSFPGKLLADADGGRLFIADTNHHRVVVADMATGEVLDVAGSGRRGLVEGGFASAGFDQPQGLALSEDGTTLYVADVGNHSVRALDLDARTVTTLLGTGEQTPLYPPRPGVAPDVALASPWDLTLDGPRLFIAMAGSHQVWALDLTTGFAGPVAGSGREGVANGPAAGAELAQPSGLALDRSGILYFADSESSAIRSVDTFEGSVDIVAGTEANLFDFGDEDGVGTDARLQHPLGVEVIGDVLYVADTYNSKIKAVDIDTRSVTTVAGGDEGWADGVDARYSEPGGLSASGGVLWIADTNNHAVRSFDPATGETATLVLWGIERFEQVDEEFTGTVVTLDPITVGAGAGLLEVTVAIPDGYKVNDIAPFSMTWSVDGAGAAFTDASLSVIAPEFPVRLDVVLRPGMATLTGDLTIYYCTVEAEELCLIDRVRLVVPIAVEDGPEPVLDISYAVVPPQR